MFKLRFWIGVLAWWFFLFFNIERITEPVNIASFVYVLAPVAAGVMLVFPWFSRQIRFYWLLILTLLVYFILKFTVAAPVPEAAWLPLTVLEIACLFITLLIVRQFAEIVVEFEDMMTTLTFRQLGLPPRLYERHDSEGMYREVKRSRRFQHEMTLLVVEPDSTRNLLKNNKLMQELENMLAKRFLHGQIARSLSETLRDTDLISQYRNGFAVILPETSADDATKIIAYTATEIRRNLDIGLKVGIASFPGNAVTLSGLLDVAVRDLEESDGLDSYGRSDSPSQAVSS